MIGLRIKGIVLAVALAAAAGSPAAAQAPNKDFPLGQTDSGAICTAVQDYEDNAVQARGARAWSIHCLGFDAVFGHIYAYAENGDAAVGANGPWQKALATRAACPAPSSASISGLSGAQGATCKPLRGGVEYRAYSVVQGGESAAAEGFAPIQPLIELGLKIAIGAATPPSSALQTQAGGGGELSNLQDAATAAQEQSDYLNSRAQLENKGSEYADAERDFRELESSPRISARDRVLAEYNIALNVSDEGPGKFVEADKLFAAANQKAAALHDPEIDALAYNYQALHLLNQRRFTDAVAAAEKAIALRKNIDPNLARSGAAADVTVDKTNDTLVVSDALAADLNSSRRAIGFGVLALTPGERLQIQNAQADYVIGAARSRLGDQAGARASLEAANATLSSGRLLNARSAGWLHAEVYLVLGSLELRQGNTSAAATDYQNAILICDRIPNLNATPFEGNLYLNLARAEAKAGQSDRAMQDYQRGIELFRAGKRDVSEARNLTSPYFDLLLARIQANPSDATSRETYFDTMQVLAGQGTAKVFAEFAAGASKGDAKSEQLAREVRDTNRQIELKQSAIRRAQDQGTYTADQKTADDAELKTLAANAETLQEQLLEANPKYGQVVEATAGLADMQKALQPGEIYVKTVILADKGFGIAITHDKVVPYAIGLTKADAEARVKDLRKPFDKLGTSFDVGKSHELFASIFGPIQDDVRNAKHLIYDPDSAMVSLPAAVFVTDDASATKFNQAKDYARAGHPRTDLYADTAWLGRNTDISMAISSEVFLQARAIAPSKGQRGFVAFGDPVTKGADPRRFSLLTDPRYETNQTYCEALRQHVASTGFRPLPEIRPAISAIALKYRAGSGDVVLGQEFTDDSVLSRQNLNAYRIVFFGTHGVLGEKMPCLHVPALVTSLGSGKDSDGFLDAAKILKLTMDADLVVLAACDTGSATTQTGETGLSASGDAFDGFARDFIFAGARNFVVSQWEVRVQQTDQLMQAMFNANATTQSDALRQAQLSLMKDPNYSHPYYWAGFTLVGDGAKAMPNP
jgi:CHAT domain-containing protein